MAGEEGTKTRRLMSMKLARYSKLREKMDKEKDEAEARIDRKKYALPVYGRAIFFVKKYMESLQKNKANKENENKWFVFLNPQITRNAINQRADGVFSSSGC